MLPYEKVEIFQGSDSNAVSLALWKQHSLEMSTKLGVLTYH